MVKYEFIDIEDDTTGVKITKGKYKGMVWTYGKVSFDEGENLNLRFDYTVLENPNKIKKSDKLHTTMGDILVEIIKSDLDSNVD